MMPSLAIVHMPIATTEACMHLILESYVLSVCSSAIAFVPTSDRLDELQRIEEYEGRMSILCAKERAQADAKL